MKRILLLLFIFPCINLLPQDTTFFYPQITEHGTSIEDFIPEGWFLRDSVNISFNNDILIDAAFVIVRNKSVKIDQSDHWPKVLVILFKTVDDFYELSTSATELFSCFNCGFMGRDPYIGLGFRRNTLKITFESTSLHAGAAKSTYTDYYFRYQNNDWYLIGATMQKGFSNRPEVTMIDANLITGEREEYMLSLRGEVLSERKYKVKPDPLTKLVDFVPLKKKPINKKTDSSK